MTDQAGAHTPDFVQMAHDIRFYFEANPDVLDNPNEDTGSTLSDDILTLADAVIEGRLITNDMAASAQTPGGYRAYDLEISSDLGMIATGSIRYEQALANATFLASAPAMAEELERYKAIAAAERPDFEAAHYLIEAQKAELERLRKARAPDPRTAKLERLIGLLSASLEASLDVHRDVAGADSEWARQLIDEARREIGRDTQIKDISHG